MCGLAGYVNFDGADADVGVLKRMLDVQRHRGPDDQGMRLFSLSRSDSALVSASTGSRALSFEGGLGFNRLSILDLSSQGRQPMANQDGSVFIAFNGEVYNAFDYKRELETTGFRFRSNTDTEVVLFLYERYGIEGMLERLNGMFALVVVDLRAGEVHVARDHLGVKPLYWALLDSTVLFASEAKAFLFHPSFVPELNSGVVDEFLAFRFIAGEESLLKGVRQLRPGHRLRVTPRGVTQHRYWEIPDDRPDERFGDAAGVEHLDRLLRASVQSQLLSDVKVGCQLSGGVDSSVISVIARSCSDADMETFSIVFDDPEYSEEPWIRQAATAAGARSHLFTFTDADFFDTLGKATWHMDEPLAHPNSLGIWLLAKRSREFVTVMLSGEGADELLGGYTRFYYTQLRPTVSPWLPLLRLVPALGPRLERQFGGDTVSTFIMASMFNRPSELRRIRPEAAIEAVIDSREALFAEGRGTHVGNCTKYRCGATWSTC